MTAERISLDTNILIYALDKKDKKRHEQAIKIIENAITLDCVLTLQSLAEFYHATTRKNLLSPNIAYDQVQDWASLFPIVTAKTTTLTRAIKACHNHQLSFWDAMLWATARDAGVTLILSEDFSHSQIIDNVKIINPFRAKNISQIFENAMT